MAEPSSNFKDTIILPRTEFPMKGNLAKREPELLARWKEIGLHERIAAERKGAPKFVLHDGPPYANGNIHYGHILNKILKDMVVKYRTMAGYDAPYVPGWDTHGLPIELGVEREVGGDKLKQMSKLDVRQLCHAAAMKWMNVQREEFQRLGVFGQWDRPYLTLQPAYEAAIARAIAAFVRGGSLYRGKKPVHWCPSCQTALAEAEIEYHEHTSPSIYVRLPLANGLAGKPAALVIWTTTPWTLPANLAVVLWPEFEYVGIPKDGELLIVAKGRAEAFVEATKLSAPPSSWVALSPDEVKSLEGQRYAHPFMGPPRGDNDYKVWFADHVTLEAGTGLVHTAPGHGVDDYKVGLAHGLDPYAPVDDAGKLTAEVPSWAGLFTAKANPLIAAWLAEHGFLLNQPGEKLRHQYPHCWRCKNPVIFRATPQWFIAMDHGDLRQHALEEIDKTEWIPPWGRNRIHGMIEKRPDWCISRQRAWGVPIPVFYCTGCEEPLVDADVIDHVAGIFGKEGADAWFARPADELIPSGTKCSKCAAGSFRKEGAIVDVWFESGVSWYAVCAERPDLAVPADLYLEGSDQHRGWFHSALLTALGVIHKAPYKAVLTHGFVLDEFGKPYSKSEIAKARAAGKKIDYIPPEDVIGQQGAELLRLWVSSVEFRGDMSYSKTILTQLGESYRKIRNTARFVLGNLDGFSPDTDSVAKSELTGVDAFAMAQLDDFIARVSKAYADYEFHVVFRAIVDYVTVDLSAFYLDVTKDRLYCDAPTGRTRRGTQTVMYAIGKALATLTAPILAFTAEDIWSFLPRAAGDPDSVHLALLPEGRPMDEAAFAPWKTVLAYRSRAQGAIEPFRAAKHHPLEARVTLSPAPGDRAALEAAGELADLFGVSAVILGKDASGEPTVTVDKAPGHKCPRCWKWHEGASELESRCAEVVAQLKRAS